MDDGTNIALRRHGNPGGPRLVVCHGNGLASDLYYPFWSMLTGDCDLIIYDLRNHGWNEVTAIGNHNVPSLVRDHDLIMETIDSYFGDKPKVGSLSLRLGADLTPVSHQGERLRRAHPVRRSAVQTRPDH